MSWSEIINRYLPDIAKPLPPVNEKELKQLMSLIDLTSLNDHDTSQSIATFIEKAQNTYGHVAAVCVYSKFLPLTLNQNIKIATVANFPHGNQPIAEVVAEIKAAMAHGANELDIVFPYTAFLNNQKDYVQKFLNEIRKKCGNLTLKIILETGAFPNLELLAEACKLCVKSGANFLKTSTGKIEIGATVEAAIVMLVTIKKWQGLLSRNIGIKLSGGIRDIDQARQYVRLAKTILGENNVSAETVRIGASQLVDKMLAVD